MSERITIGGVVYESIGSSASNLLLKCNGTARVQWGNKFIDLVKNGKLASNDGDVIRIIKDESELKQDGIYVLKEDDSLRLTIRKNGETYNITDSDLYISASNKQQITVEQQKQALENIGFYYNTLEEVNSANIENGLVYVLEDSNLYIVKDGNLISFKDTFQPATVTKNKVEGNSISEYGSGFSRGMIVMYSGLEEIPEGWGICDGRTYNYNGITTVTPNLVNRFIKAVSNFNEIGMVDQDHLSITNDFTLNVANLDEVEVLQCTDDNSELFISSEEDLIPVTRIKAITTQLNTEEQAKVISTFKIEPNYYALIFIIKL